MCQVCIFWGWGTSQTSGQTIIVHQPRFPWNKKISLTKPPFGVRSCEVAIIWPETWIVPIFSFLHEWHQGSWDGPNYHNSSASKQVWTRKEFLRAEPQKIYPKIFHILGGWFFFFKKNWRFFCSTSFGWLIFSLQKNWRFFLHLKRRGNGGPPPTIFFSF